MAENTVVMGLGNTLLCDEGVGVRALQGLVGDYGARPDVELVDGGTLSFTLAPLIEDASCLVIIDAAQMDAPPGTVRVFEGGEMDRFVGGNRKSSVHEVSLLDLLTIAHLAGHLPSRRALIGVQPGTVGWSETLTPPVAAALSTVHAHVRALLSGWGV